MWDASKAFIRGKIIAYSTRKKKIDKSKILQLESQLKIKETQLSLNFSKSLLNEVCKLKLDLNEIYHKKAEYALFRTKANFFENGEKASKLLARQLIQQEASFVIPGIRDEQGKVVTKVQDINLTFQKFYTKLYSSVIKINERRVEDFLSQLDLPQLSSQQAEDIDSPITENEVRAAIQSMKGAKSPGIDGFPIEYYKHNIDISAPILTELYEEASALNTLPDTLQEALISLILKKRQRSS